MKFAHSTPWRVIDVGVVLVVDGEIIDDTELLHVHVRLSCVIHVTGSRDWLVSVRDNSYVTQRKV